MNILVLADFRDPKAMLESVNGVDYHRIIIPALNLRSQYGHRLIFSNALPDNCNFDVVIKSRTISNGTPDKDYLELEKIKQWGIPLVIDIDDYYHLPEEHILYQHWYKMDMDKRIMFALENANEVWASTKYLQNKIGHHNQNMRVMKNAIDKTQPQFETHPKPEYKGVRLGWAGTYTHTHDFPILRPAFVELAKSGLEYSMHLGGLKKTDQHSFMVFMSYAYYCANHNINYYPAQPSHAYANFYRTIDACVVPLASNEFNSCKSELKLLEAAAFELPVVASACLPYYQNDFKDAVLFAKEHTWYTHLKTLITSAKKREYYGKALKAVVDKHYNIKHITEQRHNALCQLTGKK